ncbi:MAG: amidohydrolase family protein [Methanomassiliicoccales archaeon]|nr:amidohydrolase family protein [Methanomassiliicoccales archaeon]
MRYLSGQVLGQDGFFPGYVGYEDGLIMEVEQGAHAGAEAKGLIVPTLVNGHTHIADYLVPMDPSLSLEELVAPPNGLKHRVLENAKSEDLMRAMLEMKRFMARHGTSHFLDFREGGYEGSEYLRRLDGEGARSIIMGRPKLLEFCRQGTRKLLKVADGIAVSAISDWDGSELKKLAAEVRSQGRPFAIHVSERVREDIDQVLDLKPSYLVHMTEATAKDMRKVAEAGVPVVVCPRSNLFFGKVPPLKRLLDNEVTLALGTDNAMICLPDMLSEMEMTARLLRSQGRTGTKEALNMAMNGRKLLNGQEPFSIEPGARCELMVLRHGGGDPTTDLVLRSASDPPELVCIGRNYWR